MKIENNTTNKAINLVAEYYATQMMLKNAHKEVYNVSAGRRWTNFEDSYYADLKAFNRLYEYTIELNPSYDLLMSIKQKLKSRNNQVGKPKASLLQMIEEVIRQVYTAEKAGRTVSDERKKNLELFNKVIRHIENNFLTKKGKVRREIEKLMYDCRIHKAANEDKILEIKKNIIESLYKDNELIKGEPPYYDYFIDFNEVEQYILSFHNKTLTLCLNKYKKAHYKNYIEINEDFDHLVIQFFENKNWMNNYF